MSKPKKPKKKYVPRAIMIPRLISTTDNFDSMEKALNQIVETGEAEVDEVGFYIYKDNAGGTLSFESNLRIWASFLDIWKSRASGRVVDTAPLWKLQAVFEQHLPIDEELVDEVLVNMGVYGKIVKPMPSAEARDIMLSVKVSMVQYRTDQARRLMAIAERAFA